MWIFKKLHAHLVASLFKDNNNNIDIYMRIQVEIFKGIVYVFSLIDSLLCY